jgi:hypothetical protein
VIDGGGGDGPVQLACAFADAAGTSPARFEVS